MDGKLQNHLSALRRRALAVGTLSIVGWAILAAIMLWLTLAALDLMWELSPAVRVFGDAAAPIAAAVIATVGVVLVARRATSVWLARRLDAATGAGGVIVAGHDLATFRSPQIANSPLSGALADMAVERAGNSAAQAPAHRIVPLGRLWWSVASLAVLAAAVVATVFLLPSLATSQWLRFSDPFGDHPPFSLTSFDVQPGDTKVPYGSGLDIAVTTSGSPVERLELVLKTDEVGQGDVLPMFPEPGGRWRTVLTSLVTPTEYYVRSGRARSQRFAIGIITTPRLEKVRFRVTPPAYTRHPATDGPLPQGGLAGLPGTQVEVRALSNRPLSAGTLRVSAAGKTTPHALVPTSPCSQEVVGQFEIQAAGKFELEVVDVEQSISQEKFGGSITLLTDETPFVRITQPPATSLATPEATLPVNVSAEDDYGIARVQLFRSLNDSRSLPLDFELPAPPPTRFDGSQALPLSAYGLQPGDVIKLFARVEDNDPAAAKGSESPVVVVRIISQKDFERMVRTRQGMEALVSKYRQAQRRLESLATDQEQLLKELQEAKDGKLSPQARESIERLTKRLRKESQDIRATGENELPFDLDRKLSELLSELAGDLENELGDLEKASSNTALTPAEAAELLEKLLEKMAARRKQFDEEAMEPLEHLELIYPLLEDQEKFAALYLQQRDLAERSASLKGRDHEDNPQLKARMRTLEAEQRKLHEALGTLLDDIEYHAARLPQDEKLDDLRAQALKFADAVRASGASEAMTDAESGFASFSGTEAHAGATSAADILEKFVSQCQATGEMAQACLKFQPKLSDGLGATVEQLLAQVGLGKGGGSGYSMRRSSLDNTGLFGQLPGMDQLSAGSNRDGQGQPGGPRGGHSKEPVAPASAAEDLHAGGGSSAAVPARYRSRVGAYFQRVADDSAK